MKMRRVFLGAGAIVMAMASLGLAAVVRDYKAATIATKYNIPPRFKKKRGPIPRGRSGQRYEAARLIIDRASSFHKMRRWTKAGLFTPAQPDQRSLMRHSWYRRQKEKEARAAATVAWQQAAQ